MRQKNFAESFEADIRSLHGLHDNSWRPHVTGCTRKIHTTEQKSSPASIHPDDTTTDLYRHRTDQSTPSIPQSWVACTAKERVSPAAVSHTRAQSRHGSRPPPPRSRSRSSRWPRRAQHHQQSAQSSVTRKESHRSRSSLVRYRAPNRKQQLTDDETGNKILRILKKNGTIRPRSLRRTPPG